MITTKKTNNTNYVVDIGWQKGSKWANYGNMAKMNTTIKTTTTTITTTMTITMTKTMTTITTKEKKTTTTTTMLISNCKRAKKGKLW